MGQKYKVQYFCCRCNQLEKSLSLILMYVSAERKKINKLHVFHTFLSGYFDAYPFWNSETLK